jgi:hypothetical protein
VLLLLLHALCRHAALMAGPFTQLQLLPQLRELELALPVYTPLTMDLLGALVQLTRLSLKHPTADMPAGGGSGQEVDCWPLAALVNLRQLHLYGMYPCTSAAAAGAAPAGAAGALPPFLTQLVLTAVPRMECWVPHLCASSSLEHLELEYVPGEGTSLMAWQGHPCVVLMNAAPHLPHLTFLQFSCLDGNLQWDSDVEAILEGADPGELPASQYGHQTPLHPVKQMSHLTALQEVSLGPMMELVCETEEHWRYLASLTALRSINCVAAGCLPPLGVQLEGLTFLDGWVDDDTLGYVCCAPRVCPRLEELHLTVWEGWELPAVSCRAAEGEGSVWNRAFGGCGAAASIMRSAVVVSAPKRGRTPCRPCQACIFPVLCCAPNRCQHHSCEEHGPSLTYTCVLLLLVLLGVQDADGHRFHHAAPASTLREVKLTCNGDDSNSLVGLLQHVTPARSLDITWPTYDCDFLPDLSCLPALTRLVFRPTDSEEGAEEVGHAEHVLGLVLGLGQLRELELHNLLLATPRLALALQHEYPHLRLMRLVNCGSLEGGGERGPSDSAQLDRVVRLLRPDLRIEEVGEDEVVVDITLEEGGQPAAGVEGPSP